MAESWLAHSANPLGCVHTLRGHLYGVCERVEGFAHKSRHLELLKLAALLHDLGKYQPAFQRYLQQGGVKGSVPHARWGALLARALHMEEVSVAIDGHHAGLPDYSVWANDHTFAGDEHKRTLLSLYTDFAKDTGLQQQDIGALCKKETGSLRQKDIRTRFVFSCLTDADWLDTEAHFSPEKAAQRENPPFDIPDAIARVDAVLASLSEPSVKESLSEPSVKQSLSEPSVKQSLSEPSVKQSLSEPSVKQSLSEPSVKQSLSEPSALNTLRNQARLQALQKAGLPVGFFALNLPTGLGKTLTSFRWALAHALANGLERIIIVLPYTSIIDQTAVTLAAILGQNAVLEHHSSHIPPNETIDNSETNTRKKLACENWDSPVIVTTTVQFFETLFSNLPGKCRKLHRIAQSVVILDEVQSLPKQLVLPTLDMLRDVQEAMNTSFVFCTATMPAFEARPEFPGLHGITPLVEDVPQLFEQTQRVRYSLLSDLQPVDRGCLETALCRSNGSTLVIANTKRVVRELYAAAEHWPGRDAVYHLSTAMCPHHRKAVIAAIRTESKDPAKNILVFSTQMVEAGVDLDFPCVFRELAPLESIIQAAGRCNREGRLNGLGEVVIFQLADSKFPDALYATQARHVCAMLSGTVEKLNQHASFAAYYAQVMALFVTPEPITSTREQQNFSTAAGQYRLIQTPVRHVFVWNYNDESKALYQSLRAKEQHNFPLSRAEFRAIQQFSVPLYESDLWKTRGIWEQSVLGVYVWNGDYNAQTGLDVAPPQADALIL